VAGGREVQPVPSRGAPGPAPRAGVGYASFLDERTFLAFVGVIGSYRGRTVVRAIRLAHLADNWVRIGDPTQTDLAPNESFAARDGTGNGTLQAVLGAELSITRRWGCSSNYGHWAPLWNDPGDFYRFAHDKPDRGRRTLVGAAVGGALKHASCLPLPQPPRHRHPRRAMGLAASRAPAAIRIGSHH
jgi:hypothetical protein